MVVVFFMSFTTGMKIEAAHPLKNRWENFWKGTATKKGCFLMVNSHYGGEVLWGVGWVDARWGNHTRKWGRAQSDPLRPRSGRRECLRDLSQTPSLCRCGRGETEKKKSTHRKPQKKKKKVRHVMLHSSIIFIHLHVWGEEWQTGTRASGLR